MEATFDVLLRLLKEAHEIEISRVQGFGSKGGIETAKRSLENQARVQELKIAQVLRPELDSVLPHLQKSYAPSEQPEVPGDSLEKPPCPDADASQSMISTSIHTHHDKSARLHRFVPLDLGTEVALQAPHRPTVFSCESSPWMIAEDVPLYSMGLDKYEVSARAKLWRKGTSIIMGMRPTNMIDSLALRRGHSLRERTQIRIRNLTGRSFNSAFARQKFRLRKFSQFSRQNPITTLDSIMSVVIILNSIAIGVSCETSEWKGWFLVDLLFVSVFTLELFVRIWILGLRDYLLGVDASWHWFEMILIACSILELWAYSKDVFLGETALFRMFRLLRLAKMSRVLRLNLLKDMIMMFNGAIGALRTLFWSVCLLSLPLYMAALVFRESLGKETALGDEPIPVAENFSSLVKSFFTIFRCIMASDCSDANGVPIFVLVEKMRGGWVYSLLYSGTFLFMTIGLCNVVVAIYVENTVTAAKYNDLKKKDIRLRSQELVREKALELSVLAYCLQNDLDPQVINLEGVDLESVYRMRITHEQFTTMCEHPGFCEILDELDIDRADQPVLFDALDTDRGGTLDVNELINGVVKLRGDIRKSDIVAVLLGVRHMQRLLKSFRHELLMISKRHDDLLMELATCSS